MAQPKGLEVRITVTPDDRWERGVPHDARSEEVYGFISDYDYRHNGDSLALNSGGDGDNGESLMYLLDEYFAAKDRMKGNTDG